MIAVARLTRAEIERRLAPYKCKHLADLAPGFELWKTGWDEPFTLYPEDGYYDEFQYRRVLFLVSKTMPPGWTSGNG
jgi:hypothetical protein